MPAMTRAAALAYLTDDDLATPGSRYGRTAGECAPTAYALACVIANSNGEEIDAAMLDGVMSSVVNDADDVLDTLRDGAHLLDGEDAEHVAELLREPTPEHTRVAVYGDEHGELFFACEGETPGDVAHSHGELIDELRELIENAATNGTTRFRLLVTRTPAPGAEQ